MLFFDLEVASMHRIRMGFITKNGRTLLKHVNFVHHPGFTVSGMSRLYNVVGINCSCAMVAVYLRRLPASLAQLRRWERYPNGLLMQSWVNDRVIQGHTRSLVWHVDPA